MKESPVLRFLCGCLFNSVSNNQYLPSMKKKHLIVFVVCVEQCIIIISKGNKLICEFKHMICFHSLL